MSEKNKFYFKKVICFAQYLFLLIRQITTFSGGGITHASDAKGSQGESLQYTRRDHSLCEVAMPIRAGGGCQVRTDTPPIGPPRM